MYPFDEIGNASLYIRMRDQKERSMCIYNINVTIYSKWLIVAMHRITSDI